MTPSYLRREVQFAPIFLLDDSPSNFIQCYPLLTRELFHPLSRASCYSNNILHQRFDTETLVLQTRPHREVSGLNKKTSQRKCCIYKVVPKATFCNFDFACCKISRRDVDQNLKNKGERLKP